MLLAMTLTLTVPATSLVMRGPASAAPKKGTASAKAPKLAETGKATFWDCPSKTTLLLVVVNTLTLHPGETLDVSFTVRNGAKTSWNYTAPDAGVTPGPTSTTLTAGPCGSVEFSDRGRPPPQRLARERGRQLPGARLCVAGRWRHCVGHGLVAPDRAEQHAPCASRALHTEGRERALQVPPARREILTKGA